MISKLGKTTISSNILKTDNMINSRDNPQNASIFFHLS